MIEGAAVLAIAALLRDVPCDGCLLEVPSELASPAPLVVALHGDEGSPAKVAGLWAPIARELGFVLLAPRCPKSEGCDGSWWRWDHSAAWVIKQAEAAGVRVEIDPARRYLTGWSGGASYASLHIAELSPAFAAFSLAGGGIATESTPCLAGAGGACAPARVLAGELNPHFFMSERTKEALEKCGHTVEFVRLAATDHAGEWRAYTRDARKIAKWMLARKAGCSADAPSENVEVPSAEPSSRSASASSPPAQSAAPIAPPSARAPQGCGCSVVGSPSSASQLTSIGALIALLMRGLRARSRGARDWGRRPLRRRRCRRHRDERRSKECVHAPT
ncbi:MAG: hypothetical protein HOV80_07260 [Polyangiaceae bacterium]|nr:hypothetical protein [Polyangiaceae bacterium]